jgi:hypothetical protein
MANGISRLWSTSMNRHLWRLLQGLIGLAVLFYVVRQFSQNWNEIRSTRLEWQIQPLYLVAAALLTWSMYGLLIVAWRRFLLDWGQSLDFWTAARIWSVSSLGKYVPGKVWAIAGMAIMAQRAGVAAWAATTSAILLQGLAVGSGVMIVGVTGTTTLESQYPWVRLALWILAVGSAIGIGLMVSPILSGPLVRRFAPGSEARAPRGVTILLGIGANLIAWVGYGLAFWLLAHGTLPGMSLPIPLAIGAFAASYLAGLLFLIAPGGLFVRESVMVLMLQSSIGLVPAGALAVASRLLLTLTEVGIAVPFLFFLREKARAEL